MRVLVTGARGLLGAAIAREFTPAAEVRALGARGPRRHRRSRRRRTPSARARPTSSSTAPPTTTSTAPRTSRDAALRVNAFGVLALARAARRAGATLVHYSTDFVFDGETDRAVHGGGSAEPARRLRGVEAARRLVRARCAARVRAARREPVRRAGPRRRAAGQPRRRSSIAFDAATRCRCSSIGPCRPATPRTSHRRRARSIERSAAPGLYHCVNTGAATWAEIAEEAARLIGCPLRMKPLTLETAALARRARATARCRNAKLAAAGIVMPPWQDALGRYLGGHG